MKTYILLFASYDHYVSTYDVEFYRCKNFTELKYYVKRMRYNAYLLDVYDISRKNNLISRLSLDKKL